MMKALKNIVNKYKNLIPLLGYLFLSLLIVGPLLQRGYILHYDMIFVPHVYFDWEGMKNGAVLANNIPTTYILKFFQFFIPGDVVQKIILIAVLFFTACSMYFTLPVKSRFAKFFGGLFYVLNPFVYDRFIAGHWLFLIGYALTPVVFYYFFKFYKNPSAKNLIFAGLLWGIASVFSMHHLVILGIAFLILGLFFLRSPKDFLLTGGIVATVLVLNCWWFIPSLTSSPEAIGHFDLSHFYAFDTLPDSKHGLLMNMLGMYGFWHKGWALSKEAIPLWPFFWFLTILPFLYGVGYMIVQKGKDKKIFLGLVLIAVVSLFITAGPSAYTASVNSWLYTHVPGFSGLRESQKVLSLLVFVYAYIGAIGLDKFFSDKKRNFRVVALAFLILSLAIYNIKFFSVGNELKTVNYPSVWYQQLESEKGRQSKILALPWEAYIEESFSDKLMANPTKAFFGPRVIQSRDMKVKGVDTKEKDAVSKEILSILDSKDTNAWLKTLKGLDIKTIVILKTKEHNDYSFLLKDSHFKLVGSDKFTIIIEL